LDKDIRPLRNDGQWLVERGDKWSDPDYGCRRK